MPAHYATTGVQARTDLSDARVLVVGLGGLGCPALRVLVQSGVTRLTLVDDDRVDASNLQRQTLYTSADEGALKVDAAALALAKLVPERALTIDKVVDRFYPDTALELLAGHDLVLEGADNFATKFLVADAAKLARVPCVQAGAVRFAGWALGSLPDQGACVRCIFEDIPRGAPETCAVAGVLGPVVGAMAAIQAALTIQILRGLSHAASVLYSYDALAGKLRKHAIPRRADCALCSGQIRDLSIDRYSSECAA